MRSFKIFYNLYQIKINSKQPKMEEYYNEYSLLDDCPNKRNKQLLRRLDDTDINEKKLLISSLIKEWELDKSSFNIKKLEKRRPR